MTRKGARPISPPDLPSQLPTPLFPPPELATGLEITEVALSDWGAAGQSADHVRFEAVLLERTNLSLTVLKRVRLRDVRIARSDLSNAAWGGATLERVELLEGRLTGFKAPEATLTDVRVRGCKLDLAQFRRAKLRDVGFEDCILREADFQGADLSGVSFRGSDLQGANFTGARLERADFRGVRLDGLVLRPADLKGMIIDSGQAMELATSLAQFLGMTVAD